MSEAASFGVNTTETVTEGDTEMTICAEMTSTPAVSVLDKEIIVTLSTMSGTGVQKQIRWPIHTS